MGNRTDNTITLADGRRLGYAEFGDTMGKPVLYFHGFPSSRLEAAGFDDIARRVGARVVGVDRPGFGLPRGAGAFPGPQPTH